MSHLHWHSPRHGDGALVEQTLCTADERAFRRSAASLLMRDEARRISSNCRSCYTRFSPPIRFAPGLMTVDVLFLAAAVPQAPVGDARAGHIPVGADIQEAARAGTHIREAARDIRRRPGGYAYPGGGPGGYAYPGGGPYPGGGG